MAPENQPPASRTPDDELERQATAFVFGELDPQQAAAFEKQLNQSSELQATVASIREAVAALETEFAADTPQLNDVDRQRVTSALQPENETAPAAATSPVTIPPATAPTSNRADRRWVILLATAAALLLIAGLTLPRINRTMTAGDAGDELRQEIDRIESENDALRAEKQAIEQQLRAYNVMTAPAAIAPQSTESPLPRNERSAAAEPRSMTASKAAPSTALPADGAAAHSRNGAAPSADANPALGFDALQDAPLPPSGGGAASSPAPSRAGGPTSGRQVQQNMQESMEGMSMEMMGGMGGGRAAEAKTAPVSSQSFNTGLAERPQPGQSVELDGGRAAAAAEFQPRDDVSEPFERPIVRRRFLRPTRPGDRFAPIVDNPFRSPREAPLSTFSIDVDTASYAKVRMDLMQNNRLPDPNAVRIEEMINYFDYDYPPPAADTEAPFAAAMEIAGCPWNPNHRLARIGIKGKVIDQQRPPSNLVFLLDVSGSMNRPNKLPLVLNGMRMLVNQLDENDSVALVVYAGAAGMVLDATPGDQKKTIYDALDRLRAGGSTNGGEGIRLAYEIAREHFIDGGTNRVILCSDGDFNVGVTGTEQLVTMAVENAKDDIFLTVLGFGTGNHNDDMMEKISNRGNGNYAFIDSADEARKVFVDQMQGTLVTIAKDVKIQVEFNPREVQSYRLIGYANRLLAAEDFNDDTKDAGEIGAGHTVTALYEIVPVRSAGASDGRPLVDDLRYQQAADLSEQSESGELLTLKLRYKPPTGDTSTLLQFPVSDSGKPFEQADQDFQFAASVAAFGMLLRDSQYKGNANYEMVQEIAASAADGDRTGYREEFMTLVKQAEQLLRP
jgi:Ca-activated chloride channel family protein